MNIRQSLRRLALTALAVVSVIGLSEAAMTFSTGTGFLPGARLIDGTDLNVMVTAVNTLVSQAAGTVAQTGSIVQSASANAEAVGPSGATNPTFNVDASTASAATGLNVKSAAAAAGVAVTAISSGTNEAMFIAGKGTGQVNIGGTTTTLAGLQVAQTASAVNDIVITNAATGSAAAIAEGGAGADANRDLSVAAAGTGIVALGQTRATCSGTTTATCQGQRFTASVTGLSTAAGGVSATAMVVTNASVATSAVLVVCNVNGYSGTGQPIATNVTPGTGSVSFQVTNIASSGSLNATVPVACVVF